MEPDGEAQIAEARAFYQQLLRHAQLSQAVATAAEWGLADLIGEGIDDLRLLSTRLECDVQGIARLLGVLERAGIVARCGGNRYQLTTRGALLRSNANAGVRSTMTWWGRYRWQVWSHLGTSLRTGQSSRALALGTAGFEHLDTDGAAARVFHAAMGELACLLGEKLAHAYDLAGVTTVVDLGGGDGTMLSALLAVRPDLTGVLVDRPHALASARVSVAARGVADRCELVPGDFFSSVPATGDLYILQRILHDWDDAQCIAICSRCREAMPDHARLLVIERVLPSGMAPPDDCIDIELSDLNMLVMLGARERTEQEIDRILAGASMQCSATVPLVFGFRAFVATAH